MTACLFCVMREEPVEGNHAVDPADLCPKHLNMTGIPEYLATHPNGECSETCGCVSLDEMMRQVECPS
jgi:hypothetical protein